MNMLKMCWNWKVLAGLAAVAVAMYLVAPNAILAALPLLVLLACPLSMVAMMWGMRGMGRMQAAHGQPSRETLASAPTVPLSREEQLASLRAQLQQVGAQKASIARQIEQLEANDGDGVTARADAVPADLAPAR